MKTRSMETLFDVLSRDHYILRVGSHPSAVIDPSSEVTEEEEDAKNTMPNDVTTAILAKLPAESLQKFRRVCKSWNYMITHDNSFGIRHFQTQSRMKKKPRIVTLACVDKEILSGDDYIQHKAKYKLSYTSGRTSIDFSPDPQNYFMTNSCNGLVGVFGKDVIYLANPSIAKVEQLPMGSPHAEGPIHLPSIALGFDSEKMEYKVIRIFNRICPFEDPLQASVGCEVLSLGASHKKKQLCLPSWRVINDPPLNRFVVSCSHRSVPFVLDGSVYWQVERHYPTSWYRSEIALSFSLSEEKFGLIKYPQGMPSTRECTVFGLRGCVALAEHRDHQLIIWSLKDHKTSVWLNLYNIDLSYSSVRFAVPMTNDNRDTRIVIYWNEEDGVKMYYDPLLKCFVGREVLTGIYSQNATTYTESIVWPWP